MTGRDLHGWFVAVVALVLVGFSLWIVLDKFSDATDPAQTIVTILAPVYGILGTVVGAYFGISAAAKANETTKVVSDKFAETNRLLAEKLP
jgi:ABC-type siderophore export system fused ATPase/permease subunit